MVYRGEHLVADFDAVNIAVDGKPVKLTRREFELLRYLVENRNRVLSRDRLLERVWGYERVIETRSVDVHVGRLRSKLGAAGHQIETVVGLGYRFVDSDAERSAYETAAQPSCSSSVNCEREHAAGAFDPVPVLVETRRTASLSCSRSLPNLPLWADAVAANVVSVPNGLAMHTLGGPGF